MTWKFEPPVVAGPYCTLWLTLEQRLQVQQVAWMVAEPWASWPELFLLDSDLAEISPLDSVSDA